MDTKSLPDYLRSMGVAESDYVYDAFSAVDRRKFVPKAERQFAYIDHALPIGHGQTISQPYTVALMLDMLNPLPGQKMLDVGSGSGWTTALLAHITGPKGRVIGVERVHGLVKLGRANIAKFDYPWAEIRQAKPGIYGAPDDAPFDRILVSASASEVPKELLKQLASPGVMVIPIGYDLVKISKDSQGRVSQVRLEGFIFVPLI
jgi:protein-L-isoaspartate(D-aspartate) O-methyltransferase